MKAITIWQPWAEFIAAGVKHNETRSWATKYRGPIAIHAAVKPIRQVVPLLSDKGSGSRWSLYRVRSQGRKHTGRR